MPTVPPPQPPSALRYRRWLHLLAVWLVVATFILIVIGGAVTSHDAGMAVPHGWDTFGVWSLIAPLELWWDDPGTRLEHSHRLKGYAVGFSTIAVFVALLVTQRRRRWMQGLGGGLLLFVIAQGVLGILRVDRVSTVLAAVHGVTGQVFLCMTVLAASAVGAVWLRRAREAAQGGAALGPVPASAWGLLLLLLLQLALGSAVRHSNAGEAIPDWPLHYGRVVPPLDQTTLMIDFGAYHLARGTADAAPVLPELWQVHVHAAHRLGAYGVVLYTAWFVTHHWRRQRGRGVVTRWLAAFAGLVGAQVALGVYTVFSGIDPTLATLHQTVGAAVIALAAGVAIRLKLFPAGSGAEAPEAAAVAQRPVASGGAAPRRGAVA